MFEPVFINIFGDTKMRCLPDPGWRLKYQLYLAGYEAAEDKGAFNARADDWMKHFPDPDRDRRDEELPNV